MYVLLLLITRPCVICVGILSEVDLLHQMNKTEYYSQKSTQCRTAEIIIPLHYQHRKEILHRCLLFLLFLT